MQLKYPQNTQTFTFVARVLCAASFIILAMHLIGCQSQVGSSITGEETVATKPLRIAFEPTVLPNHWKPRVQSWSIRNKTQVVFVDEPKNIADADVVFIRQYSLGSYHTQHGLQPVPTDLTKDSSEFQWNGLTKVYRSRLTAWGSQSFGVPLLAEASVLVYRHEVLEQKSLAEEFRAVFGRNPLPIRTWEDFAQVAQFYTRKRMNQPALVPLPTDTPQLLTSFGQIAACYDRAPYSGGSKGEDGIDYYRRGLSFYTDAETGLPRWPNPAFLDALRWFHETHTTRASVGERIESLTTGQAVLGILSLAELAKLPLDDSGQRDKRFGIAAMPGSTHYYTPDGTKRDVVTPNTIPYYGGLGVCGVVPASSAHPELAWNLLADLGGVSGTETTLDDATLGGGPLRLAHLADNPLLWRQYRLDEERTQALSKALRRYDDGSSLNPAIGLRTPNTAAIYEVIAQQIRAVSSGSTTPEAAEKAVTQAWKALDDSQPQDKLKTWRRKTAGLD
jgi:multiple sugar transport system substrate-binding protein